MPQSQSITPLEVCYAPIPNFPGYKVGTDGEVWSCWCRGPHPRMTDVWRRLAGIRNHTGHLYVNLVRDGTRCRRYVHRLVLEAFVGPCPEGMEGCHDPDRDPTNNRRSNLRWDTRKANYSDSVRHGTAFVGVGDTKGEKHAQSKLTEDQVRLIAEIRRTTGFGCAKVCRLAGLPDSMRGVVDRVIYGHSWTHVTGFMR